MSIERVGVGCQQESEAARLAPLPLVPALSESFLAASFVAALSGLVEKRSPLVAALLA